MAAGDIILAPDWPLAGETIPGELESVSDGGEVFRRVARAPIKTWLLMWTRRPQSDYQTVRNFLLKRAADFFTFDDLAESRKYSVWAMGKLDWEYALNNTVNMRLPVHEAIGKPMNTYPQTPLSDSIHGQAQNVGTGWLITYAGYGFTVSFTGDITAIFLDGATLGDQSSPYSKYDIAPNLHRVEVRPAGGIAITNFQYVF